MGGSNFTTYERDRPPLGISWEEWTILWWRWALSVPRNNNPGITGKDSFINQGNTDVIFLTGTFGGKAERKISIPRGKSILIPIINFTSSYAEEPFLKSEEELLLRAKKDIDDIVRKEAVIDGVPIRDTDKYRIATKPFRIVLPPNNVFNAKSGETTAVSDGYWLFLKPLAPGMHHISAFGSCSSGKTSVDITYTVTVNN